MQLRFLIYSNLFAIHTVRSDILVFVSIILNREIIDSGAIYWLIFYLINIIIGYSWILKSVNLNRYRFRLTEPAQHHSIHSKKTNNMWALRIWYCWIIISWFLISSHRYMNYYYWTEGIHNETITFCHERHLNLKNPFFFLEITNFKLMLIYYEIQK